MAATTDDDDGTTTGDGATAAFLPVGRRLSRGIVLAAVFVCAASGLVYELALVALGSYLIGNSVQQASIVISVFVFAMGIGSLSAKRLVRWPVVSFAVIELALALLGGLSVMALYAAFAWLDLYQPVLVVVATAIGMLIGAEIPVLMAMVQRIRAQAAADAAADLFAVDYIGALVGGLAFPFLLLPVFGQIQGAMVAGAVNALAAAVVCLWLFRGELSRRGLGALAVAFATVVGGLGYAAVRADQFEASARQALYDDPIVYAEQSRYQDIVLTDRGTILGGRSDVRLFLNGDLQFSSIDEYRYHEALVHPAMSGPHERVLVLGGGDGLALREVLRYDDVEEVIEVELDPAVIDLARTDTRVSDLNEGSLDDPRVQIVNEDAFGWLRDHAAGDFDVVIVDMPDPDDAATAKLYSVEFYGLASQALAEGGRMAVQGGSPYFAQDAYWSIDASLAEADLETVPYHVDVPSFGDWGFFLTGWERPAMGVDPAVAPDLRFVDEALLTAAQVFPRDRGRVDVGPSTLMRPTIIEHERRGWKDY
ncbi:polyamine aminopropyltransferase [Iamia sp.]|uniref:polyamine aminopropyltransferase n=1 Tax=Iamia sp. TaxID=2722710 RepID=UPI002BB29078|nr:polyamine aminopropyltransferase [Iamia sp.]HXH57898.1 polyamine aminopropyltransferase [Iamia sp.]